MSIRTRLRTIERRSQAKGPSLLVAFIQRDETFTANDVIYKDAEAVEQEAARHPGMQAVIIRTPEPAPLPPEIARARAARNRRKKSAT